MFILCDKGLTELYPPKDVSLVFGYWSEQVVAEYDEPLPFPEDEEWYEASEHWWREVGRANIEVDPEMEDVVWCGGVAQYLCSEIGASSPRNVAATLGEWAHSWSMSPIEVVRAVEEELR